MRMIHGEHICRAGHARHDVVGAIAALATQGDDEPGSAQATATLAALAICGSVSQPLISLPRSSCPPICVYAALVYVDSMSIGEHHRPDLTTSLGLNRSPPP